VADRGIYLFLKKNGKRSKKKRKRKRCVERMIRSVYLGNHTDGIFAKLNEKGHISSEYFVSTVTSCLQGNGLIPLRIGREPTPLIQYWRSDTKPGNSITIEFKKAKVSVDALSIMGATSGDHMLSFVVEGSNDNFSSAYEQTNLDILRGGATLTLASKNHLKFKYVRMKSTGVNGWGGHQIVLYIFELFGSLIPDNFISKACTCNRIFYSFFLPYFSAILTTY
jgi:hypothetical protein